MERRCEFLLEKQKHDVKRREREREREREGTFRTTREEDRVEGASFDACSSLSLGKGSNVAV